MRWWFSPPSPPFHLDVILFKYMKILCHTQYSSILKLHSGECAGLKQQSHFFASESWLKRIQIFLCDIQKFACILSFISLPDTGWKNLHGKIYLHFENKIDWCPDFDICWIRMKCHIFTCSCFIMIWTLKTSLFFIFWTTCFCHCRLIS